MKPPKPPSWKDFIDVDTDLRPVQPPARDKPRDSNKTPVAAASGKKHAERTPAPESCASEQPGSKVKQKASWFERLTMRNKLHRTRSQHALEACGKDLVEETEAEAKSRSEDDLCRRRRRRQVVSVNLCDEKYRELMLDLCNGTQYDNMSKCEQWLAGVHASGPLEDVVTHIEPEGGVVSVNGNEDVVLPGQTTGGAKGLRRKDKGGSNKENEKHGKGKYNKKKGSSKQEVSAASGAGKKDSKEKKHKSSTHRKTKQREENTKPEAQPKQEAVEMVPDPAVIKAVEESLQERLKMVLSDKRKEEKRLRSNSRSPSTMDHTTSRGLYKHAVQSRALVS